MVTVACGICPLILCGDGFGVVNTTNAYIIADVAATLQAQGGDIFCKVSYNKGVMALFTLRRIAYLKRLLQLVFVLVVVITGVTILTALTLGYSFNRKDGKLVQGGLLQFGSTPSGANIIVNNTPFGANTPNKQLSNPGEYTVSYSREGYRDWKKTVPIKAGQITWLTYAHLIPKDTSPQVMAQLPGTLADGLPSGGSRRYAFLHAASKPEVSVAALDDEQAPLTKATLPADKFTAPAEGQASTFKLQLWSGNEQYLLLRHTYGDKTEWILFDYRQPAKSINISRQLGFENATNMVFGSSDGRQMYALVDNTVRLVNLSDETVSRPLVSDVERFSLYGDNYILYVTKPDSHNMQQIGYTRRNYEQPVPIKKLPTMADSPVRFAIGKYYHDYYVLVAQGHSAQLSKITEGKLPDTPKQSITLKKITDINLGGTITRVRITSNGQLAMVQDGNSFATYNLELGQLSTTTLAGQSREPRYVRHFDTHLLWAENEGKLRTYEFDGANQHDLVTHDARFDATLSPSQKYLYTVRKQGERYQLVRVKMIL